MKKLYPGSQIFCSPDWKNFIIKSQKGWCLVDSNGSVKTIISGHGSPPQFYSDKKIIFDLYRQGYGHKVILMSLDGSEKKTITSGQKALIFPDGKNILYEKKQKNGFPACYIVGIDGTPDIKIFDKFYYKKIFPNGKWILFLTRDKSLNIISHDGTVRKVLVTNLKYGFGRLAISPDSKKIVYFTFKPDRAIMETNLDGTDKKQLLSCGDMFPPHRICFSPNGKYILFEIPAAFGGS